ncbi:MAG: SufD family Fe-S cluster assembly protein, partial [Alphaproteobacteria bacterium]|nr:SufD family Fe-S cluster assembly protein [Alphaproteobacteria bacterium]
DDVKCGHGATAGELDEQALFYLRARGIGRETARAMLIEAFVSALVDRVEDEAVRAVLADGVSGWLARAPAVARAA